MPRGARSWDKNVSDIVFRVKKGDRANAESVEIEKSNFDTVSSEQNWQITVLNSELKFWFIFFAVILDPTESKKNDKQEFNK